MSMIRFEWKKLFRSKVYYYFLGITILFIIGLFVRNYYYQDIIASERIEHFKHHSSTISSQLITDQKSIEEMGDHPDPHLVETYEAGLALHTKLRELITSLENNEKLDVLQIENRVYELALHYQSLDGHYPMSRVDMENEMKLNNYLLEKVLPKENLSSSIQIAVFMKQVSQYALSSFVILILLIIVGTPILKEFDDQTIKLTYVLPVSSNEMIIFKWMSACLAGISWLIVIFATSFTVAKLFGRTEENVFDYPFFTGKMDLIPASEYFQQVMLVSIFYLFMVLALFIFLSFSIKNSYIAYIVLSLLFIGNYIVLQGGLIHSWLPWNYQEMDLLILQTETFPWVAFMGMISVTILWLIGSILVSKRRGY